VRGRPGRVLGSHSAAFLAAVLLAPALGLSLDAPVAAQEAEEVQTPIEASAQYVGSATAMLPRTITSDVPPLAVCIVVPEACPPELDPVRDPLREAVGDAASSDVSAPLQPIPPGSIAVGYLGGATRHQAAILFDQPTPPAGEEITQFDLVLAQGQPTFDMDSPAFRRIVLGLFLSIGPQDPQPAVDGLVAALQDEEPVDLSQKVGIEACLLLAPFDPAEAPQGQSDEALPRDEETGEPAIDCVLGGLGTFDPDALTWTLDLRFAARAWASGEVENHGLLLRPIGVQNLAFGDPDPLTNAQVTLDLASATGLVATAVPPSPPVASPASPSTTVPGERPPTLSGGTGFGPGESVSLGLPSVTPPDTTTDRPEAASPATAPLPTTPTRGPISQPWWIWLMPLVFVIGIRIAVAGFVGSATAPAAGPPGALTRLLSGQDSTGNTA
jgi:hypothetical protein